MSAGRLEPSSTGSDIVAEGPPTTGAWKRGDRVWDATPTAGGVVGWVCVTAGTPGTWRGFGAINTL